MTWEIKLYEPSCKQVWDSFVTGSRNGTFLFYRGYMDYHADRFQDCSLMCYRKGKLHAIVPAHLKGDVFCSHSGLTYGGIVYDGKMTVQGMLDLFTAISCFLRTHTGAAKWVYSPVPYIYACYPAEEDLYALFRFGARLVERKVSTVVPLFNKRCGRYMVKRREGRKARKEDMGRFTILQDADYAAFWKVLESNLEERHGARPVHSLDEIELLHSRFPSHIILYRVCTGSGETVAGCVLYVSRNVVHVQYIGSTAEGRAHKALDLLFAYLMDEVFADARYFDMGTSVEKGGRVLNEGLVFQKEGFGGRAVVYDTYEMDLPAAIPSLDNGQE